ncbi:hypothetical protein HF086_008740 [Spodoptera exigua]|uniref:Uncharacterized protein n=1 Tax=Spodoptera exigua TaxID=7107 RepID=A0A922MT03_SPOEX|nr:hypothetical protein HF086_008740 [Spodoptera exigua]
MRDKFCKSDDDLKSILLIYHNSLLFQLSYCGQECRRIPPALQKMYGNKVKCLDLSYNCIETLKGLEQFSRLEELILDNNKLGDAVSFPYLSNLKTLSLNNNEILRNIHVTELAVSGFPSGIVSGEERSSDAGRVYACAKTAVT